MGKFPLKSYAKDLAKTPGEVLALLLVRGGLGLA